MKLVSFIKKNKFLLKITQNLILNLVDYREEKSVILDLSTVEIPPPMKIQNIFTATNTASQTRSKKCLQYHSRPELETNTIPRSIHFKRVHTNTHNTIYIGYTH